MPSDDHRPPPADAVTLRAELRAWRRTLEASELARRAGAAAALLHDALTARLDHTPLRVVAAFHAVGGELDPEPAADRLAAGGIRVVVPVLDGTMLRFADRSDHTAPNRYGIPEPTGPTIDAAELDVVLVPAVAVDSAGHRLGMGGGYYDRTFAARRTGPGDRPLLVAWVHDEQVVDAVPVEPWDVAMDVIVTPTRWIGRSERV